MRGQNPTEPATILSRISKLYSLNHSNMCGKYIATGIMPFFHINPAMMTVATVTDFLLIITMGLIIGRSARVLRYGIDMPSIYGN